MFNPCSEIPNMAGCASREDCVYTGFVGPCQTDFWNCTCPNALYGQSGWKCSCRVTEAFDKALKGSKACDALYVQGASHLSICPEQTNQRCKDLVNDLEGTWHTQGKAMRGDWVTGDWWTLPLRLVHHEEHLLTVPSEYVRVCVFDRVYTLGSDVLDYLRSKPLDQANLLTRARTGVAAAARLYEYRMLIPDRNYRRRHLQMHSERKVRDFEIINLPVMGGDSQGDLVEKGTEETRKIVTKGVEVCGKHTDAGACRDEAEYACHWSLKDGVSFTCWPDTNNCLCRPETSPAQYACSCAEIYKYRYEDTD